jgi:hypothetical protein
MSKIGDTPAFQEKKGHNSWTVNVNFTIIELNLYCILWYIALC